MRRSLLSTAAGSAAVTLTHTVASALTINFTTSPDSIESAQTAGDSLDNNWTQIAATAANCVNAARSANKKKQPVITYRTTIISGDRTQGPQVSIHATA